MNGEVFWSFVSVHTLAFMVGCYMLTWLTRRVIEVAKPNLKPVKKGRTETYKTEFARWWNSFILYLIPPAWGLLAGYILYDHLTWPKGFESLQAVMFFGMVCGWLSGLVYKGLMKILQRKLGVKDEKEVEREAKKAETDPKVAGEDKKKRKVEKEKLCPKCEKSESDCTCEKDEKKEQPKD